MKIGYIRVSQETQAISLQQDALEKDGCERIFVDKMSGKRFDRPEFQHMLDIAREGDVIVVWKLDRLGRSLQQLIETVNMFGDKGIELRSLRENIDTTTSSGKFMFHIMGAIAEFERDIIRERTMAGLEAARARGKFGGRRKATDNITPKNLARAKELYAAKQNTVAEIMQMTGFKNRSTFYKYVAGEEEEKNAEEKNAEDKPVRKDKEEE